MKVNLRDDVTFHTGRKFTANDVKFSLDKVLDPASASQVAFIARQFKSVEVTGPTALTITFSAPLSNIFDLFAQTNILDKETFAGLADGSKVIGTGPYVWAGWNPGASYSLKRYEGYRDKSVANLDSISYDVIGNSTAVLSAVRSGRSQIAYGMSITDTQSFAGNNQYSVKKAGGTIYPFGMNVTVAPFDKPEVRKAVAYAIDRDRINKQVFQGTGTVTDLFWGPNTPGYSDQLASQYTYDPDKAKKLIQDAGVAGTSVQVVFMSTPIVNSIYEIFTNNLEAIGLKTSAVQLDSPTFISRQAKGDLGTMFLSTHGQVGRGPATLIDSLPTLRKGNPSQYWSSEYEQLRKSLLAATDEDSRAKALGALSSYMLDQAFVMPILQAPKQIVVSNAAQGIELGSFGELYAERAYVAK
jgi:peptide/nickel transport system substrate-binding protein